MRKGMRFAPLIFTVCMADLAYVFRMNPFWKRALPVPQHCGLTDVNTGGIGSSARDEDITINYDPPNLKAYSESCAAIGQL